MTYERKISTRTDADPAYVAAPAVAPGVATTQSSAVVERSEVQPSGGEMTRRVVVLIFGLIQTLISLRIVLLLLNAREGNDLVAFILNLSQVFVSPFIGIFNSDSLHRQRVRPRHRRDRGARRLDDPRDDRPLGGQHRPEGAGLAAPARSLNLLRRGPPGSRRAVSMAPAMRRRGERPTAIRMVGVASSRSRHPGHELPSSQLSWSPRSTADGGGRP
jgi:hypothetical protein